jgi:hypothetical protein
VKSIRGIASCRRSGCGQAITPRYRAAVLLAAWCGLRRGEVVGLYVEDVNLAPAVYLRISTSERRSAPRPPNRPRGHKQGISATVACNIAVTAITKIPLFGPCKPILGPPVVTWGVRGCLGGRCG